MNVQSKIDDNDSANSSYYGKFEDYHQSWYAVSLAKNIKRGQAYSVPFCDTNIAVYRGEDDRVRAVSSRCPHLGADVGLGFVTGNDIVCPFHHWQFDGTGTCVKLPSGRTPPKAAKLFEFPCREEWGLIWVFLGEEPLYDFPPLLKAYDPARTIYRAFRVPFEVPCTIPHWFFASNLFDFNHFRYVHGIKDFDAEVYVDGYTIGWKTPQKLEHPSLGTSATQLAKMYGVGSVVNHTAFDNWEFQQITALCALKEGMGYHKVIIMELQDTSAAAYDAAQREMDKIEAFQIQIPNEDQPILNSVEFGKVLITPEDKRLAQFLAYSNAYPKTTVRKLAGY
jgi:phenylpropionate dioxygenase-like ring-hydroxylating dioxygenase large terminal subunit